MQSKNLGKEKEFFDKARALVLNLLSSFEENTMTVKYKDRGGTISDVSGKPWTLNSTSVIAARDKNVHTKLLNLYSNS